MRPGAADAVDVGECDLDALVAREVDTNEACHQMALSRKDGALRVVRGGFGREAPRTSSVLRPLLRRWFVIGFGD